MLDETSAQIVTDRSTRRRGRTVFAVIGLSCVIAAAAGFVRGPAETIRAGRIEIVNAAGKVVATLGADANGGYLALRDANGDAIAMIGNSGDGAVLVLGDARGAVVVAAGADGDAGDGYVRLRDAEHIASVVTSTSRAAKLPGSASRAWARVFGAHALTTLEPEQSDTAAMKEAKMQYKILCSTCHGMTGRGDGLAARGLGVQMKSFTDRDWQESVDDHHLREITLGGGPATGLSPLMPGAPHLKGKDDVLDAIVQIIRWLGR